MNHQEAYFHRETHLPQEEQFILLQSEDCILKGAAAFNIQKGLSQKEQVYKAYTTLQRIAYLKRYSYALPPGRERLPLNQMLAELYDSYQPVSVDENELVAVPTKRIEYCLNLGDRQLKQYATAIYGATKILVNIPQPPNDSSRCFEFNQTTQKWQHLTVANHQIGLAYFKQDAKRNREILIVHTPQGEKEYYAEADELWLADSEYTQNEKQVIADALDRILSRAKLVKINELKCLLKLTQ